MRAGRRPGRTKGVITMKSNKELETAYNLGRDGEIMSRHICRALADAIKDDKTHSWNGAAEIFVRKAEQDLALMYEALGFFFSRQYSYISDEWEDRRLSAANDAAN
jgi:hypothetical protein